MSDDTRRVDQIVITTLALASMIVVLVLILADCQMPLRSAEYLAQRLVRIESDNPRQLEKLDHVDPPLATLDPGHP